MDLGRIRPLLLLSLLLWGCTDHQEPFSEVRRSIYKIFAVSSGPDMVSPWQDQSASGSSGTGFYIGQNRIMTNAHVVAQSTYLAVQRDGDDTKIPAYVEFVGHDCDLAIITVEDEEYFKGINPLRFGDVPELRSPVSAVGYPMGGDQLSITEGVVSRVGFGRYSHSSFHEHLVIQVDSAINPGNSGGPVVQNGQVVGVAFQGHTQAENTGYVIPVLVVRRFLSDIEDDEYQGHPVEFMLTDEYSMNNEGTRRYFGLKESAGVQVGFVAEFSPLHGWIKPRDVLLAVDGHKIGVDGKIEYAGERVSFRVIYDLHLIGDKVEFDLLREGKKLNVEFIIKPAKPYHDPAMFYGQRPRFLTFAGLVFTGLTRNFLHVWGSKWYMNSPFLIRYVHFYKPFLKELKDQEEVIVLSQTLPHPVNTYANEHRNNILTKVNGKPIANLEGLQNVLHSAEGEFIRFDFFENNMPLILPLARAREAQGAIEEAYQVSPKLWLEGRYQDGAVNSL